MGHVATNDQRVQTDDLRRRSFLKAGLVGTVGVLTGLSAFTGTAAANGGGCCRVCWVDVKPDSCPNSINPKSNGTLTVALGWPNIEPNSVKLYPVKGTYTPAFDGCQNYHSPTYNKDCESLRRLLSESDGRYATPTRVSTEYLNSDSTRDTLLKFRTKDAEFEPDDTFAIVTAADKNGCLVVGIDSVRVLDT
jgi:hypothetical protein